ncbi:alkaline phosphatase [Terrimonas sp. NA20]|uniref:Alkaline phosphatase n=1 Tax=Terrimonas ginsenosidimutans TaxID=2908004 RepID=A0ABS9KP00_9BACT|nr:alkaline phosphatase [Terrimonas ginsenosidimutans]MCG2614019.1 alkaline phosphatase [Terrimonas ginsenosidimutans]
MMKNLFILLICFVPLGLMAQPASYSVANAHSHNDYESEAPFRMAWEEGFGSIEVDVFLVNGEIVVAHDSSQLSRGWLLDSLYLKPLSDRTISNKGYVYANQERTLQLLIDLKTPADPLLDKLVEKLMQFPALVANPSLQIVITGSRPAPELYASYPPWIMFDGELKKTYTEDQLKKIVMLSDNFTSYSKWNGLERMVAKDLEAVQSAIRKAHALNKKVRFWNAPDILNSWQSFIGLGVDYINTDQVRGLSKFLSQLADRTYTSKESYKPYRPTYRNDGKDKKVKNIILLIGDGTGLPQWYAGYTTNHGALNVFNMRYVGLSKTSSYDNYITDSAPGATTISSGVKTNNRAVGVDHTGKPLVLITDLVRKKKMKTGVVTSGDITDATPASFYGHQSDRGNSSGMLKDLLASNVDLIMGKAPVSLKDSLLKAVETKFSLVSSFDKVSGGAAKPWMLIDSIAGLYRIQGRGEWLQHAFTKSINVLSENKDGFLLMLEGAKVDHGGHANKLPFVVTELMDFDQVVGKAMEFADANGETLVVVTADHETGGLTLVGGDYNKGYISGQFSTGGHTALPVPVFAYGPQSHLFSGVYENTEIFRKLLAALKIKE